MAHPIRVKAAAVAMLMTGDRVTHVAKTLGIPQPTVSRWKVDADRMFREIVQSSPRLMAMAAEIRATLPGLYGKNGYKKRARVSRGSERNAAGNGTA